MPHQRLTLPAAAGPIPCLVCDQTFESGNRRTQRLCPRCREVFAQLPFEGLPAPLPRCR
jgi:Zn finger protein HypA/HybF involved in hydrogenase expression